MHDQPQIVGDVREAQAEAAVYDECDGISGTEEIREASMAPRAEELCNRSGPSFPKIGRRSHSNCRISAWNGGAL